jgi:Tol biopolymer transport system component
VTIPGILLGICILVSLAQGGCGSDQSSSSIDAGTIANALFDTISWITSDGAQLKGWSGGQSLSGDGRYVAFVTSDGNPDPCGFRGGKYLYLHDSWKGTTTLLATASDICPPRKWFGQTAISSDGNSIAFTAGASTFTDPVRPGDTPDPLRNEQIYLYNTKSRTMELISNAINGSPGNGRSTSPVISTDGRNLVFVSSASDLISNDTNGLTDIFLYYVPTKQITRVSTTPDGGDPNGESFYPSITSDGRLVAFNSKATNIAGGEAGIFIHDLVSELTTRAPIPAKGMDGDDYPVSFAELRDESISGDGRYIAFESYGRVGSWVTSRIYILDRVTGSISRNRVTEYNEMSSSPVISSDSRVVAYSYYNYNQTSGKPGGIYVQDLKTGNFTIASVNSQGIPGDGNSDSPEISSDGRFVTFQSGAANLVIGDTNWQQDVFLHDMASGMTIRVSTPPSTHGNQSIGAPVMIHMPLMNYDSQVLPNFPGLASEPSNCNAS